MERTIALVTLVVGDYNEAISFFVEALRFEVIEDRPVDDGKRWVVVAPSHGTGASLLLAQATSPEQTNRVGNQTGGRVFLFLETSDFWEDYRLMKTRGVRFAESPREEPYGTVAVFLDLYDNRWDLIERKRGVLATRDG
jgi:catechol 2,3-dioxygenase-like lactoylglutathione lyase family enzyme